jgi:tRNA pseudouridine38-40 synthase
MVRSLVGAVTAVGTGKRDLGWLTALAAKNGRDDAIEVAPARGLTLEEVLYPPDGELAARAEIARARRSIEVAS